MKWLHRHHWEHRMVRVPAVCVDGTFHDGDGIQSPWLFYKEAYIWDECACGAIRAGNMYDRDLGSAAIVRIHTMPPGTESAA